MSVCPECGNRVRYLSGDALYYCDYCVSEYEADEVEEPDMDDVRERLDADAYAGYEYDDDEGY